MCERLATPLGRIIGGSIGFPQAEIVAIWLNCWVLEVAIAITGLGVRILTGLGGWFRLFG